MQYIAYVTSSGFVNQRSHCIENVGLMIGCPHEGRPKIGPNIDNLPLNLVKKKRPTIRPNINFFVQRVFLYLSDM